MRILFVSIAVSLFLALAFSCANQTSPTGGPKDTIPPRFLGSNPPNKSINFKSKTVELTFDEHVQVNNPREQLLISPSIKDTEMMARKRSITLKLNSPLEEATTYTINFRESIQDITEKNPVENLQLAFSTGSYLDSLKLHGVIYDLLTGKPVKDATMAIYQADTFDIFDDKPNYLTRTNENGYFRLENLKAGHYYLYGFDDKNKNIKVDSKTESYGFVADAVNLTPGDSAGIIAIPLITMDSRPMKLISGRPYNTYYNIKSSKYLKDFSIQPLNPSDSSKIIYRYGDDRANVKVYTPSLTPDDSVAVRFIAHDSISFTIDTVLHVKHSSREVTGEKFSVAVDKPTVIYSEGLLKADLTYTKPIDYINEDSLYYKADSLTTIPIKREHFTWNTKTGKGTLNLPIDKTMFKQENQGNQLAASTVPKTLLNQLIFGKGAFVSIERDSSARTEQKPTVYQPEDTGIIIVEVSLNEPNYITQLIGQDNKVIQHTINQPSSTFKNIPPGSYQLRLIVDANGNGEWDPGNFFSRQQPEPAAVYVNEDGESTISLKANWELGPLLITYPQPVDNIKTTHRPKKRTF